MLRVIEYFAKSLKVTQGHSKWHLVFSATLKSINYNVAMTFILNNNNNNDNNNVEARWSWTVLFVVWLQTLQWWAVIRRSLDAVRTDTRLHLDLMALAVPVRFVHYLLIYLFTSRDNESWYCFQRVCVYVCAGVAPRFKIGRTHSASKTIRKIFEGKGNGKGLDTCYSAAYVSQTRDQQRFTISEVAADSHEPMVPQSIMWPSIAGANGQLDPRCS